MIHPYLYQGLPEQKQLMCRTGRHVDDVQAIISATCGLLKIPKSVLTSKLRTKDVSEARCICIGLIFQVNKKITLKKVGGIFNRDHSTIIYNRELFDDLYRRDKPFTLKVEKVISYL